MARKVGIVAKPRLEAIELAVALRKWLVDKGFEVRLDETTSVDVDGKRGAGPKALQACELLVVIGGDGTMIHAAHLLEGERVPIFGVNAGYLGFLSDTAQGERKYQLLDEALMGLAPIEERMILDVELRRGGRVVRSGLVVNDAVVSKAALARIAELACSIDGRPVADYRVDGLIVSTPTGSTAYSLSAGGPIVYPTMRAVVISPICPHTLSQRPLLVPSNAEISLQLVSDNGEMFLTLDGQSGEPMQTGDEVRLRESRSKLWLVRNPEVGFFEILRQKLGWG